ncbi:type I secretion system permease/ATPase [Pseudacidovorax intermedius]|uniref:type I secretion system permease/ATPase n=1 Tax=Pseudacidovorax intermedius TaxID=433924 RepID=UPI00073411A6|nr:type I secretion system permease/ATPase [Pseudacidovorax intermedius]
MTEKSKDLPAGAPPARSTPVGRVLRLCRRSFWSVAVLTFVVELLSLAPIVYMWNTFDRVLASRSVVTLVSLTTLIVGVYLFWSVMEWIRGRLMVRLSLRVDWELAADVFDASFRRHVGRRQVNVQQVMGDLLELRQFLGGPGVLALMSAPFAVVFIIVGAVFHPYLAVFSLAAAACMLVAAIVNRQVTSSALKASNDANAQAMQLAGSVLRQSESTLALGMMPAMRRRWHRKHREFLMLQVNSSEAAGVGSGMTSFLQHCFQSLGMALGIFLAIEGAITGGMVMAATMLIARAVSPLTNLIGQWPAIVRARQAYDRLNTLLAEDEHHQTQMALPAPKGRLVVEDLAVVPPGASKVVLSGVSFALEPGQAMAIVGPSASGKSALAKQLVGVWKPHDGSVRLDGVEISDWNHDELGPHIGYVPQEIEFFDGTVAENIARLGAVDADKVVAAAQMVGMHEAILGWPKGYDTLLGDACFALSGGQRQRLAVARAVYGDPAFVVLDEPNANLDEVGEQSLIATIQQLRERGATVLVTTHRPRLIGIVDLMLVVKNGRQVGLGTPKDLFAAVQRMPGAGAGAGATPVAPPAQPPAVEGPAKPNLQVVA